MFTVHIVLLSCLVNGVSGWTLNWECQSATKIIRFDEYDPRVKNNNIKNRNWRVFEDDLGGSSCPEQCCIKSWCKHAILYKERCHGLPYAVLHRRHSTKKSPFIHSSVDQNSKWLFSYDIFIVSFVQVFDALYDI